MNTAALRPGSPRAWVLAARPPTLWAAVAPVLVGSAIALVDDAWRLDLFVVVLLAAVAIQIGVNLANDVADAARGADSAARVGPPRAVASGLLTPRQIWAGVGAAFSVAAALGLYLITQAGPVILIIGVASILAALGYTNGPWPYGYRGLGELFVFVFFGLVATVGTRYVYDRTAPADAWWGGIAMGLLAVAILVANNYRDLDTDAASGKRTLAVRLGRARTATLYGVTVTVGVAVPAVAGISGVMPLAAAGTLLLLPQAIRLWGVVRRADSAAALIAVLKTTATLQLGLALLTSAGIML